MKPTDKDQDALIAIANGGTVLYEQVKRLSAENECLAASLAAVEGKRDELQAEIDQAVAMLRDATDADSVRTLAELCADVTLDLSVEHERAVAAEADDLDAMRAERDNWREDAQRYCRDAEHWQKREESLRALATVDGRNASLAWARRWKATAKRWRGVAVRLDATNTSCIAALERAVLSPREGTKLGPAMAEMARRMETAKHRSVWMTFDTTNDAGDAGRGFAFLSLRPDVAARAQKLLDAGDLLCGTPLGSIGDGKDGG